MLTTSHPHVYDISVCGGVRKLQVGAINGRLNTDGLNG